MVFQMTDLFETSYLYVSFLKDIQHVTRTLYAIKSNPDYAFHAMNAMQQKLFECAAKKEDICIDIANIQFTSQVVEELIPLSNLVRLKDSKLEWRNEVLVSNEQRRKTSKMWESLGDGVMKPLPKFTYNTDLRNYILSLENNVIYTVDDTTSEIIIPLITVIQMLNPTINICIDMIYSKFYSYVSHRLNMSAFDNCRDFHAVTVNGYQMLHFVDGRCFLPETGYVDVDTALSIAILVPATFGSKVLWNDESYAFLRDTALSAINNFKASAPSTLAEILGGI